MPLMPFPSQWHDYLVDEAFDFSGNPSQLTKSSCTMSWKVVSSAIKVAGMKTVFTTEINNLLKIFGVDECKLSPRT